MTTEIYFQICRFSALCAIHTPAFPSYCPTFCRQCFSSSVAISLPLQTQQTDLMRNLIQCMEEENYVASRRECSLQREPGFMPYHDSCFLPCALTCENLLITQSDLWITLVTWFNVQYLLNVIRMQNNWQIRYTAFFNLAWIQYSVLSSNIKGTRILCTYGYILSVHYT